MAPNIRTGSLFVPGHLCEVYAMAAWLRAALTGPEYQGAAICLASENKAVMAAALLASLAGGPTLLLPYAFSSQALARMQQATGFTNCHCRWCQGIFSRAYRSFTRKRRGSVEIPVDGAGITSE